MTGYGHSAHFDGESRDRSVRPSAWARVGKRMSGIGVIPPPLCMIALEPFARQGVILVTINYRLNIFAWMTHPQLSAESENHVSGNYGLLDQVAALEWTRRNIAAFGGGPDKPGWGSACQA